MTITRITSQSDPDVVTDFLARCNTYSGTETPAIENMRPGWHPDGLLDLIFRQHRFDCDQGGYYISEPSEGEIWGYGCYRSEISSDVMVTGVRMIARTLSDQKNALRGIARLLGNHHKTLRLAWRDCNLRGEYCTFNDYNTKIMRQVQKINDPQNYPKAQIIGSDWYRTPDHMLLNYTQAGPYVIRNTPQYILYNMYQPEFLSDFLQQMSEHKI